MKGVNRALGGQLNHYAAVAAGSALGSVLRYGVSLACLAFVGSGFPWATLGVNLLGSWLIAWWATRASAAPGGFTQRWQSFVVAGFCGGFTTFSLFSLESLMLLQAHATLTALVYFLLTPPLWLAFAAWGAHVARAPEPNV